ncbi:MAG TPA: hypothetical protein VN843_08930 [Anaerolineales bacterium]|nr:hypothetical protein [Anaerolineales bacterium]
MQTRNEITLVGVVPLDGRIGIEQQRCHDIAADGDGNNSPEELVLAEMIDKGLAQEYKC